MIKAGLKGEIRELFEPTAYCREDGDENKWLLAKVILGVPSEEWSVRYDSFLDFDKQIYIIRDPRDRLISGLLFIMQQAPSIYRDEAVRDELIEVLRRKESDPTSISVLEILERILARMPNQALAPFLRSLEDHDSWVMNFEDRLVNYFQIKYEDFVAGRTDSLGDYIGLSLSSEFAVDNTYSHVPRTRGTGDWRNWFLEQDIECLRPIFTSYMNRYDYNDDWTPSTTPVIHPEHCSKYVERTIAMRLERDKLR